MTCGVGNGRLQKAKYMKIGFIFVLYKTPKSEIKRLKREVKLLRLKDYEIYFIDNTHNNLGYSGGVNIGLKKGLKNNIDIFVVCNPDISFKLHPWGVGGVEASRHFDIWGFALKQDNKIYYGGEIDKWRMSGGLIDEKPAKKFSTVDFPSGSLMFIKRKVVETIGLWDESYFLYYDEVDYCVRAKKAGFKIGIDSKQLYEHFEISKYNPNKELYLFKSRLKFLAKYGTARQKIREIIRIPRTIYEEITKRPFYLNFFSLNISSLLNKVLHFFLFILLIRYFKPEEYAVYTLAWTHIGLLSPLLDFGTTSYGLVYLTNQKKDKFSTLFSFRIILSILTFVLTLGLAIAFKYPPKTLSAIAFTSIAIFANMLSGSLLIFSSIANKSYIVSLVSMAFQIILVVTLSFSIIFTKNLSNVFLFTFLLYGLYGLFNYFFLKRQKINLNFKFDPLSWLAIAKKSTVFLLISLLAGFYSKADVLLLNFLKGPREVGLYSAGYRFLDALMFMVVAYNVSSMPIFSKLFQEKKKRLFISKLKKDFILLIILGGGAALAINLLAPFFLPLILKGDYLSSIKVLRVIIFALPLILLTSISLNGLYAINKAKYVILIFAFQLIYNLSLNYLLIPIYGFIASAWITLTGEALNTILSFIILKKFINENFS